SRPQPWQGCALPTELLSLKVTQIYVEKSINEIFGRVSMAARCKILNLCKLIFTYAVNPQNLMTMALILSTFVFYISYEIRENLYISFIFCACFRVGGYLSGGRV
ncbi:MAG TPA: hypothetical protein PKA53_13260, partial [Sphingobacterium sp.]|nr:hypothetical protein [Sphingobacterium sp.]